MGIDAINYKTLGNNALIANSYLRIRGLSVNKESPGFFLYMYTIQILINDQEIGMAVLRLIEIIGQDKISDLGSETLYFLINALNQMNIDPLRNEILFNVLPLRA